MKTILVPTDFSEESQFALKAAAQLAKKLNAKIVALHMLELQDSLLTKSDDEEYPELMFFMKLAKKQFSKFLDKPFLKDVEVVEAVQHRLAFKGIIDSAKKENADIIVMGSKGVSGLEEVFVGSNTEKVVRTSDIPVLVVKKDQEELQFDTFVFASNFIEDCLDSFKRAKKFADTLELPISLLYINTPGVGFRSTELIDEQVEEFLTRLDIEPNSIPYTVYNDYDVETGILKFCNKNQVDLIGIPTHGRKGLAHMLKGSISENLANHSNIPVVTFKI